MTTRNKPVSTLLFGCILFVLLLINGCLVPEEFNSTMHINKDGSFKFKYEGILTHALLREAFIAGEADITNPYEKFKLEQDFLKDRRFKKVDYLGNAQFRVLYEEEGSLDQPFYFFSKHVMILSAVRNKEDLVEVTTFSVTEKNRQALADLRMKVNGKFELTTDAEVVSHNAKTGLISNTYTWHITSPRDPAPIMLIRFTPEATPGLRSVYVPGIQKPITKISPSQKCKENLSAIDGAKEQWALEYKKTNGTLPEEFKVNEYIKGEQSKCPSGGHYTYNVIGQDPSCSLHSSLSGQTAATQLWSSEANEAATKKAACLKQMEQIDQAKDQWGRKFKKGKGNKTGWKLLEVYLGRRGQPTCPDGAKYNLNEIGFPVECPNHPR